MEGGATFAEALAEAQRLGYAEADPTDDLSGADAAAKMAILATVAFGSRVTLADVDYQGVEDVTPLHVAAARELEMVVRLVGSATLVDEQLDVRVRPAFVDRHHPLAAVEGAFNAVMLQGDAIREITLEGPGAGGIETASAVVADMVSVIGTAANGFLQNDACWRELEALPPGALRLAVLRAPRGRRPARSPRRRRAPPRRARRLGRPARADARVGRSGPPRRRPRGARRARSRPRSPRSPSSRSSTHGRSSSRWSRTAVWPSSVGPDTLESGMHSLIDRYRERLPVTDATPVVSLGEGSTPLLRAPRISRRLGVELHLKWEGANPTGSFKDRGMTVAISKALEAGAQAVICASTGNTAASAAAYAARAGLAAVVLQPAGAVASGKLAQARALGARVLEVRGSFDEALSAARALSDRGTHVLVNSLNPDRLEGQKTAAFEIGEELGARARRPRAPVRRRGQPHGLRARLRRVRGTCLALVAGEAVERATTVASAIRIGTPAHAATVDRGPRSVRRRRRLAHRRGDPPSLARARARRGRVLRAVVRSRPRGARARRARARLDASSASSPGTG